MSLPHQGYEHHEIFFVGMLCGEFEGSQRFRVVATIVEGQAELSPPSGVVQLRGVDLSKQGQSLVTRAGVGKIANCSRTRSRTYGSANRCLINSPLSSIPY